MVAALQQPGNYVRQNHAHRVSSLSVNSQAQPLYLKGAVNICTVPSFLFFHYWRLASFILKMGTGVPCIWRNTGGLIKYIRKPNSYRCAVTIQKLPRRSK